MIEVLVVQKYGGSSVGSVERIESVAKRCLTTQRESHKLAVIVSAMAGETNRLLSLANAFHPGRNDREMDVILSTGEQVSVALLALAIRKQGGKARSFLGHQIKLTTDSSFSHARIRSIDAGAVNKAFDRGEIAVIAGFQGMDDDGNITTLGRGGSDTTGVAIAAALDADVCEILTDVDGVYTTDPGICKTARKILRISYEEMLELSSLGANVLQIRSVELAMNYGVLVHVRSSFHTKPGTWVVPEDKSMEHVLVAGVSANRDEAKITVSSVPDHPGVAARIFTPLSKNGVVVDMIIQNASQDGHTDMTFTVPESDLASAKKVLETECGDLCDNGKRVDADEDIAKVSVVGVGMRSHAGVAQRMFEILAQADINIQMISTSEIRISVVVADSRAEDAVRALHDGFELDKPQHLRQILA